MTNATQINANITFRIAAADTCIRIDAVTGDKNFDGIELAKEIAAMFPKSVKMYATKLATYTPGDYSDRFTVGLVNMEATLVANGVNGGKNEAGIKRVRSFMKNAEKLGFKTEYKMPYTNSLTEAEFRALIA